MASDKLKSKVLVVGELHQDLFYKTNAFSEMADEISADLAVNFQSMEGQPEEVKQKIRKIVISTINRCSKKYGSEAYIKRGGNGNNSATIMAKIGVPTGLLTVVGTGSSWMFPEVEALGIDTSTIFTKSDPTPISTIVEDPEITKIFIANNFKTKMNFEGVELPNDLYDNAFIVFITPMDFKYKHVLDVAVHSEKLTAFTLELQKIQDYVTLEKCVSVKSEFLFCNLDDGLKVCQSEFKEPLISMEEFKVANKDKSEKDAELEYQNMKMDKVDAVLQKFANVRIYTLGKYGAWVKFGAPGDIRKIHQGIIEVPVINRTGAGDTFAAGFISKLYESVGSIEEYRKKDAGEKEWLFKVCLLFATGASSMKVSTGNAPTKQEIQDLLKKHL